MRNWFRRSRHETKEQSQRTQEELNHIEQRMLRYEERVQHLRRERVLYEQQRRRGITE